MSIISHEQFGKKSFPRGILILENLLKKMSYNVYYAQSKTFK